MNESLLDRLGTQCKDRITGVCGELRGVSYWVSGRCSCAVAPSTPGKNESIQELQWIDADRLEFDDSVKT